MATEIIDYPMTAGHSRGGERNIPFSPGSAAGSGLLGRERFSSRLLGIPLAVALLAAACGDSSPPPGRGGGAQNPVQQTAQAESQQEVFATAAAAATADAEVQKASAEATATAEAQKPTPTPEKRLTQEEAIASINSIISQVENPPFESLGITEAPQKEGGQTVYLKKTPDGQIIYKIYGNSLDGNKVKLLEGMPEQPEDKKFRIPRVPRIPGYLEIKEDLEAGRTAEAKAKLIILLQNSLIFNSAGATPSGADDLRLFPTAEDIQKVDPNGEYGLKRFTRISEVRKGVFDGTLELLNGLP